MRKNRLAFTLIELLVVIAIIGILSGLIIVSMSGTTNSANDTKRKANIDAIRKALIIYGTLNKEVYPIEASGCNIAPVGVANRCVNLATALSDSLPNLPVDPVSGYYTYYSLDGSDFNLSANLSSGKAYGYSRSTGYYTSIIARTSSSSLYNKLNNMINSSVINDSANGAFSGNVATFSAGWAGDTYIQQGATSYGFEAGSYGLYVRLRTDGTGNNPTLLPWGIYNSNTAVNMYSNNITGLTTSYQIKYLGKVSFTEENMTQRIRLWFSNSSQTSNYFIDYVEFRLVQ